MRLSVKLKNKEALKKKITALGEEVTEEVKSALLASGLMVEGDAKRRILRGPKTGRIYTRGGVTHQASSPGQAPANDHGTLASSVSHWIKDAGLTIEVGSRMLYASMLEFGTRHMSARPWLHPSFEENKKKIRALLAAAAKKGLSKK